MNVYQFQLMVRINAFDAKPRAEQAFLLQTEPDAYDFKLGNYRDIVSLLDAGLIAENKKDNLTLTEAGDSFFAEIKGFFFDMFRSQEPIQPKGTETYRNRNFHNCTFSSCVIQKSWVSNSEIKNTMMSGCSLEDTNLGDMVQPGNSPLIAPIGVTPAMQKVTYGPVSSVGAASTLTGQTQVVANGKINSGMGQGKTAMVADGEELGKSSILTDSKAGMSAYVPTAMEVEDLGKGEQADEIPQAPKETKRKGESSDEIVSKHFRSNY